MDVERNPDKLIPITRKTPLCSFSNDKKNNNEINEPEFISPIYEEYKKKK